MSNMNISTSNVGNSRVVEISGELTFNFNEMMSDLASNKCGMFGDINKLIPKLKRGCLNDAEIIDVYNNAKNKSYYDTKNIWCYLCVRPSDKSSYMFPIMESENRDNNYSRLRNGVKKFYDAGFNVYIINCG